MNKPVPLAIYREIFVHVARAAVKLQYVSRSFGEPVSARGGNKLQRAGPADGHQQARRTHGLPGTKQAPATRAEGLVGAS